ncbi:MAG: SMP-30/gluconolactonase/LRE family protein [Actinomycetota bacterium]
MGELTELATGLRFPEGPIWMPDGSVLLVEIERGTLSRVVDGTVEVVADCGGGPNGAAIGPDGAVWICNNGGFEWHRYGDYLVPGHQPADYAGGSIQRVDLDTGEVETVYAEVDGNGLRGPNDIVFDGHGGFWFTDHGKTRPRDRDRGGLYYALADGSEVREVAHPMDAPNGVGLSPDGDRVYVAETHHGRMLAFDLDGPGRLAGDPDPDRAAPTCLATLPDMQLLDSLAVDAEGNVCVATIRNGGITIIPPEGESAGIDHVPTGDPLTTNICFGGDDLRTGFITLSGTGRLVSTPWSTAGLPLAH